ncbi:MAG: UbiX family flavin prenyltransferase [Kiritimatiellia bacterium]|nr:UbiX family flavin prenyltransferase [Kiritimatiellia bacterium]MDP6810711.1 UbiX family flavin prenyltransferase [Kiritimatiellia bacterium]MDP7023302.1 UbiX family flavin prenyltransferase [Kiritimatiellia bacterium]
MNRHDEKLVLGVTGATGTTAASLLLDQSPWPVALITSRCGAAVYEHECEPVANLAARAAVTYADDDGFAPIASGSVATVGMVVLPCTTGTLGKIASGLCDTLITRAAHCHLKERRPLILCVRETPWTAIDFANAERVTAAGGIVMPLSPPYYMFAKEDPDSVSMRDLLARYVERVLAVLGRPASQTWGDLC